MLDLTEAREKARALFAAKSGDGATDTFRVRLTGCSERNSLFVAEPADGSAAFGGLHALVDLESGQIELTSMPLLMGRLNELALAPVDDDVDPQHP